MMYHCAKFHACIIKRTSSKKNCIYLLDNFVIIEPTVLYDSGNLQKSGNRVRNQKIRSEITLEIKKSHYKSTEITKITKRNHVISKSRTLHVAVSDPSMKSYCFNTSISTLNNRSKYKCFHVYS